MTTEPENGNANRVRTSDAEREKVAETLRNAVSEGRLTLEEGDQRLAALYTTKYRDELPPLLAELPRDDDRASASGSGATGHSAPGRGQEQGQRSGWGQGRGGPWGRGGFDPSMWRRRRRFGVPRFGLIALILLLFFVVTGHFFWPIIPILIVLGVVRFGVGRAMWHHHAACHAHHDGPASWNDAAGWNEPGRNS